MKIFFYRHNKKEPMDKMQHVISFYDFTVLFDGEISYEINGEKFVLSTGDAIFIPPESIRIRDAIKDSDYVSMNFYSDEKIELPVYMQGVLNGNLKHLISVFDGCIYHGAEYSDERFELLLKCAVLEMKEELKSKSQNLVVEKIKRYINSRISEKIKLEDVGKSVFLSPVYCDLLFKKETGKSIIDFTLDERIKKAVDLLLEGTTKLSSVAELTGFSDYNYFSRIFKKRVGYTPSEYKKLYYSKDYSDDKR